MGIIDTITTLNIISTLLVPYEKTPEYKMGLIDKEGNRLVAYKDMTSEQKSKFSPFRRIVFYLRKIMSKHPAISSLLAYHTIKKAVFESEQYSSGTPLMEASLFFSRLESRLQEYYDINVLTEEEVMYVEDIGTLEEELAEMEQLAFDESTVAGSGVGISGVGDGTVVVRSKARLLKRRDLNVK